MVQCGYRSREANVCSDGLLLTSWLIRYVVSVVLFLSILIPTSLAQAPTKAASSDVQRAHKSESQTSEEPEYNKSYVYSLISSLSSKYNVSAALMQRIVDCETGNDYSTPDIQSQHRYTRDYPKWGVTKGEQEKSYGPSQIHLPSHPNITYQQATDPRFALSFLAKNIKAGNAHWWACY